MPEFFTTKTEKARDECLHVVDSRTGKPYTIPIHGGDYIQAADIAQITASDTDKADVPTSKANGYTSADGLRPLRILDNGFQHTACTVSSITFVYVVAGHRLSL